MGRKKKFSEDIKTKCLLLSDRHCCVCDISCGLDIEIAHIDPKGSSDFDNAIPVCYRHHAEIGRYNREHPRGNKYRIKELKIRREQIYEKYTRHLVPPLLFYLTPRMGDARRVQIQLPRVGFTIENHGSFLPARFKVNVRAFLRAQEIGLSVNPEKPYYTGGIIWNLNPGHTFYGNFSLDEKSVDDTKHLRIEVNVTVIDEYDRNHPLLPTCYSYDKNSDSWFTEPTSFNQLKAFMNKPQLRER